MAYRYVSKVNALQSQSSPKSQNMPFDFGVQKTHSKGKNCTIAY